MKRLSLVVVCLLFATVLSAQMPKPGPELKALESCIGTWDCKGELLTSPEFGPGHAEVAVITGKWTHGNFYVDVHFKETKTVKSPEPYDANIFLGYDGEIKKYVFGSIDNTGTYETAQSGGWEKDVMTFEGPIHTGAATFTARDVFTKKGTTGMSHTFLLKEKDGSWRKIEEDHCSRAKK